MEASKSLHNVPRQKTDFKTWLSKTRNQQILTVTAFLLLPLVLLLLFTYLPLFDMVKYSFYKWDGYSPMKYIGLKNYNTIFTRSEYMQILKVSLYYFVGSIIQIAIAVFFATVFQFGWKGKNFFKGLLFFPSLLNGVAIGFIFLYFFKPDGAFNTILIWLGADPEHLPLWLGNYAIVNISLTFVSVWRYMGNNMVLFSGAEQSINNDYFEAAQIDGASHWQQFRYIIFPGIRGILALNLILAVKGAISVYEIPLIITKGLNGSMTFVIKALQTAFTGRKIGLASAMGVFLLLIIAIVTILQKTVIEKER